ncbi:hypothetical protein [Fodinibius sp. AD559]|uniref:hypothetical protein n=1 Tax=Fodinibius sp. AD559 TaxID=3424179 RepID=UPI004046E74F
MRRLLPTMLSLMIILLLFTSCGDDSTGPETTEEVELSKEEVVQAVSEVLRERGFNLPEEDSTAGKSMAKNTIPGLYNYVSAEIDIIEGDYRVRFNIGPDGNIIPNLGWREDNPDHCRQKNRYMKGAIKRLNYKIFKRNDGWAVFVQYIDVATTEIENQREGQDPDPDISGLKKSIDKAMDKFEPEIGEVVGPCGEKFPLKFVLTSQTTLEGVNTPEGGTADIVIEDEVEAEVALTYNDQKKIYEGRGEVKWVQYDVRAPESSQQIDCALPGPQDFNIPRFYDGTVDSLNQGNELVHIGPIEWGIPRPTCTVTYDNNSTSTQLFKAFSYIWGMVPSPTLTQITESDQNFYVYAIENWQEISDNDDVLARREYNRTETADTLGFKTYTEETTMEIRRDFQSN